MRDGQLQDLTRAARAVKCGQRNINRKERQIALLVGKQLDTTTARDIADLPRCPETTRGAFRVYQDPDKARRDLGLGFYARI
jgi:hypothetical protein